jgi:hypothetical protein
VSGPTSFRAASADEWTNATLNYPLTIGDHLWTDRNARAELDLGTTVIRVAPLTEFSILNLDDRTAQLRVTQGSVVVRVREREAEDDVEVDTPNGAADLLMPGSYRVDVNQNGDASIVTVRHGEAEVTSADETYPVQQAQAFTLRGTLPSSHSVGAAVPIDDFENWSLTRDRHADITQSARYVSKATIGYADLDDYGAWRTVPEYGAVWVPRVSAEWVPYRTGHWVWINPWGWTWVDDEPWGFAPFHYGRWVNLPAGGPASPAGGWAWVPGRVVARPVYAPALVAFVGGSNWHVSLTAGSTPVGWFPLAPREVYVPTYRVSPTYVRAVNVTHVNVTNINVTNVNVTNVHYVNRDVPHAVTVVSRETFVQSRPVAAAAVAVPREQIRTATVIGTPAPVPARARVAVARSTTRVAAPPPAVVNRQVVVRRPAPPAAVAAPLAAPRAAPAYVRAPEHVATPEHTPRPPRRRPDQWPGYAHRQRPSTPPTSPPDNHASAPSSPLDRMPNARSSISAISRTNTPPPTPTSAIS